MPGRDLLAYLQLIEARANRALEVLSTGGVEEFLEDPDRRDIAFACLVDIGEAIRQMAELRWDIAERITDYRSIADSRNAMSHQLFSRDYERFWHDLTNGLPVLLGEVREWIALIQAERHR